MILTVPGKKNDIVMLAFADKYLCYSIFVRYFFRLDFNTGKIVDSGASKDCCRHMFSFFLATRYVGFLDHRD